MGPIPMIGPAIWHYRVAEKLSEAADSDLGRFVVLKLLPEDLTQDQQAFGRFPSRSRAASALRFGL